MCARLKGKIRVGIAKTFKSIFIVLRSSFESTLNPVNKLKHSPISCVCVCFVRFLFVFSCSRIHFMLPFKLNRTLLLKIHCFVLHSLKNRIHSNKVSAKIVFFSLDLSQFCIWFKFIYTINTLRQFTFRHRRTKVELKSKYFAFSFHFPCIFRFCLAVWHFKGHNWTEYQIESHI